MVYNTALTSKIYKITFLGKKDNDESCHGKRIMVVDVNGGYSGDKASDNKDVPLSRGNEVEDLVLEVRQEVVQDLTFTLGQVTENSFSCTPGTEASMPS